MYILYQLFFMTTEILTLFFFVLECVQTRGELVN